MFFVMVFAPAFVPSKRKLQAMDIKEVGSLLIEAGFSKEVEKAFCGMYTKHCMICH